MIEAIGRWVRSEVCRQVCGWNAMGLATAASFNVSLRELQSLPPALCYGETTVIVPFMPESPGATDWKSTVPGPTMSTLL